MVGADHLEQNTSGDDREMVRMIQIAGERATRLTRQLLDFSRKGSLTFRTANVVLSGEYFESLPDEIYPGSFLQLDVSDTGVGIPEEIRERIFEPFFTPRGKGNVFPSLLSR